MCIKAVFTYTSLIFLFVFAVFSVAYHAFFTIVLYYTYSEREKTAILISNSRTADSQRSSEQEKNGREVFICMKTIIIMLI